MYRVVFYFFNKTQSKDFDTLNEALSFWQCLPFETFCEMYKI